MKDNWVDRKFKKSRVTLEVDATIYARIPKHTKMLISDLKKAIKALNIGGCNIKVSSVTLAYLEEPLTYKDTASGK
jgi:hypothetical protein